MYGINGVEELKNIVNNMTLLLEDADVDYEGLIFEMDKMRDCIGCLCGGGCQSDS